MIHGRRVSATRLAAWILVLALPGCLHTRSLAPSRIWLRPIARDGGGIEARLVLLAEHAWLLVPEGCPYPIRGEIRLTVHFHGAPWFAAAEHQRRGAKTPLLVYGGMQGSSAYAAPFQDPQRFQSLLDGVAAHFHPRATTAAPRVTSVEISSFSAGYGAVRELLSRPEYVRIIDTVVLADSLYASFAVPGGTDRTPLPEQMAPFIDFAKQAARGDRRMLVSFSSIQTASYSCTVDTAYALVAGVGGRMTEIGAEEPAEGYRLIRRFDRGNLHVWGYTGDDERAHMAHARLLPEWWAAAESLKAPRGR